MPQRRALLNAEAVLLVDHDQAEVLKADLFLDEGVGTDNDINFAGGDLPLYLLLPRLFQVADEQRQGEGAV